MLLRVSPKVFDSKKGRLSKNGKSQKKERNSRLFRALSSLREPVKCIVEKIGNKIKEIWKYYTFTYYAKQVAKMKNGDGGKHRIN